MLNFNADYVVKLAPTYIDFICLLTMRWPSAIDAISMEKMQSLLPELPWSRVSLSMGFMWAIDSF